MADWRVTIPDVVPDAAVDILEEIGAERGRQMEKWGDQSQRVPVEWHLILSEEMGEVSKEVNEMTYRGKSTEEYRKELIQVAAVAVAAIEALDKQIGE